MSASYDDNISQYPMSAVVIEAKAPSQNLAQALSAETRYVSSNSIESELSSTSSQEETGPSVQDWADAIGDAVQDLRRRSSLVAGELAAAAFQPLTHEAANAEEDVSVSEIKAEGWFSTWNSNETVCDGFHDKGWFSTWSEAAEKQMIQDESKDKMPELWPEPWIHWKPSTSWGMSTFGLQATLRSDPPVSFDNPVQFYATAPSGIQHRINEFYDVKSIVRVGWRSWAASQAANVAAMAADAAESQNIHLERGWSALAPQPEKNISLKGPVEFYATAPSAVQNKINEFYDIKSDVRVGWRNWAYASLEANIGSSYISAVAPLGTKAKDGKGWGIMDYVPGALQLPDIPAQPVWWSSTASPSSEAISSDDDWEWKPNKVADVAELPVSKFRRFSGTIENLVPANSPVKGCHRGSVEVLLTDTSVSMAAKYLSVRSESQQSDWFERRRSSVGPIPNCIVELQRRYSNGAPILQTRVRGYSEDSALTLRSSRTSDKNPLHIFQDQLLLHDYTHLTA